MDIQKIRNLYNKTAVLDNNIISDFIELDSLDIINKVFLTVMIPASIYENEVLYEDKEHLNGLEFQLVAFETVSSFELFSEIRTRKRRLTDYDVEVIVIAHEKAVLCSSNELEIKKTCDEYGIKHTGTIGILCCAYENGIITKVEFKNLLLKLFYECSCRISRQLMNAVISNYPLIND